MNESKQKIIGNIIIASILSIAIIISCFIGVYGLAEFKSKRNNIKIKGFAVQQITSDLIVWTGYFSVFADDLKEGYNLLEKDRETVKKYLIEQGFTEQDLIFSSITTDENYVINEEGENTYVFDNYELSQTVTIRSNEIDKVTEVSRNATDLLNEGIQFESFEPEYHYTKLADLKVSMLAEATKDATKRAGMIAENSGSKLGDLSHAHISDIEISPLYTIRSDNNDDYYDYYGYYDYVDNDTSSLEKEVTVVVYCTFEID